MKKYNHFFLDCETNRTKLFLYLGVHVLKKQYGGICDHNTWVYILSFWLQERNDRAVKDADG